MKKLRFITLLAFAMLALAISASAQVNVSGSTGADGTYGTLRSAFTAINAGSQTGNTISISISGNTTETATAILNAGDWTSILITPIGGARTISGAIAGTPLIDLNGADNVTIDGLNALTISNTSTAGTAGTSTIRFINDATFNTITNTTILGSTTGTAAQNGAASSPLAATILIGGSIGSAGNDNNQITNNDIADSTGGLPVVAISSAGQSTSIANDNVIITGNNIFNFYGTSGANGVAVGSNSSAFNISNNKFYQTASRSGLASSNYWEAIFISTASGGGYTVNGNTIGYAGSNGTGMLTNSGGRLVGIDLTAVAAAPISNIQGNTINGINWTTASGAATAGAAVINGIVVKAGGVNIGGTNANTIGATSGTGTSTSNIFVTSSTTGTGIWGIYVTSATGAVVSNNNLGAIAAGGAAAIGFTITGIEVAGTGSHIVTSNTIGNSTANNIAAGISGTTTATTNVIGIASSATGGAVSLGNTSGTGNTVQNMSSFGSSTSSLFYGVRNTGAAGTINMNYNTFTANTLAGGGVTAATIYYANILNGGAATSAININNNTVISATISAATFAGTSAFIVSTASGASSAVSIQNNILTGFTFTGATGGTGSFYGIYHQATAGSKNISNNNFNNLTLKTSGAIVLMSLNDATTNVTVSGNAIGTQLTRSVSSGNSLLGIYSIGGAGVSSGTHTISNNNLSNITSTTTSTATTGVVGILWQPGTSATSAPAVNITGNTVTNYNNSSGSATTGILADWSSNLTISGNTVSDLTTGLATTGNTTGIQSSTLGATANVFKNKIYNLSSASTAGVVTGINVASSASSATTTTYNIYNNLIGNLTAASSSGTNQVIGIGLVSPNSTNSFNLYFNTIYLNAASSGANFGSSGVSVSTTPTVRFSNNIFTNLSTPNGTGLTVTYRRSSATLTTYASTSNNNDFYAGTPSASRLIFYDGTNSDQTIEAFKVRVSSRDSASFSENPTFLSTIGSNTDFLHIDPTVATQIESGGIAIAGITDDFDGQTRNVATPDIGADEFTGIAIDLNGPVITYTNLLNTSSTGDRVLNISVVDVSGVPTSGVGLPVIYYRKNGGAYASAQCIFVSGNNYSCSIAAVAVGGVTTGDVIGYYVAAQDTANNVSVSPSAGASGLTANPPAASTPPTAPNQYTIVAAVNGSLNVGTGETYTSLTNAGGIFEFINNNEVTGNITINITSDLTGETGTVALNQYASGNSITIKPSGTARTITSTTTATGLITLFGADNVTIDGSTSGSSDRSLTLINQNSTGSGTTVVSIISLGIGAGATNNTVKNTIIQNGARFEGSTTSFNFGIYVGGNGTAAGADNDNTVIFNNLIQRCQIGMQVIGDAAGVLDNLIISDNTIGGSVTADYIGRIGMQINQATGAIITKNTVKNHLYTAAADGFGILLGSGFINSIVTRNNVTNLEASNSGGYGMTGIYIATANAASNLTVANNFVSDIRGWSWTSSILGDTVVGIRVVGANTGGINIWYNSVNLFGNYAGANQSTVTAAFMVNATAPTNLDVRNNNFVNSFNNTTVTTDKNYAVYTNSSNSIFSDINYNNYFVSGSQGVLGAINSTDVATLPALQTATAKDANSVNLDPLFISGSDLHLQSASPVRNIGTVIPSVTIDYDGQSRPNPFDSLVVQVDIGADEFYTTTAAPAEISGRVVTAEGNGIVNAAIIISGGNLSQPIIVKTGTFGSFKIDGLTTGQTYIVTVQSKRFEFDSPSRVISLEANVSDLEFVSNNSR